MVVMLMILMAFLFWSGILGFSFLLFFILFKLGIIEKIINSEQIKIKDEKENKSLEKLEFDEIDADFDVSEKDFKYEMLSTSQYIPRLFLMGRGSWRATQGNIYTSNMLDEEIENEFSQKL